MLDETSPLVARKAAAICATLFFVAPASYWTLERYVATRFRPWYSYRRNATSDLGIPYAYHDPAAGHNRPVISMRSDVMNFNFVAQGILYLTGHIYLWKATAHGMGDRFANARITLAALYCAGIMMVAAVPGSPGEPKPSERRSWLLHTWGAIAAILAPHINCILVGLSTPAKSQPVYRKLSLLLGTAGILGTPMFLSQKRDSPVWGFWQRWMLYVNPVWEATTAVAITSALLRTRGIAGGIKRA